MLTADAEVRVRPEPALTNEDKAALAQAIGDTLRHDIKERCSRIALLLRKEITLYAAPRDCYFENTLQRHKQLQHTSVDLPHDNTTWCAMMREIIDEVLRSIIEDLGLPYRAESVTLIDVTHAYNAVDHSTGQMHAIKIVLRRM